jgi:hypothetical protein
MYLEYSYQQQIPVWESLNCYFVLLFFVISWNGYQESDTVHAGHLGFNEVVTNSFKIFNILKGLGKKIFKNSTI